MVIMFEDRDQFSRYRKLSLQFPIKPKFSSHKLFTTIKLSIGSCCNTLLALFSVEMSLTDNHISPNSMLKITVILSLIVTKTTAVRYSYVGQFNPAQVPGDVTSVIFSDYPINTLQSRVFVNFTQCERLRFGSTNISVIQTGTWEGLDQLQELRFYRNELTVLKRGMFRNLSSLTTLSLWYNKITVIEHGALETLHSLTELELSHNNLHEGSFVPEVWMDVGNTLLDLNLQSNQFTTVPANALLYLRELEDLDLSFNRIVTLHESAFRGLTSLKTLSLNGNNLRSSMFDLTDVFADVSQTLKFLYLDRNEDLVLESNMFSGFPSLEGLSLSALTSFQPGVLKGLQVLQSLSISNQYETRITPSLWLEIGDTLLKLEVSFTELRVLYRNMFVDTSLLERLRLIHNRISEIQPGSFNGLSRLKDLQLYSNELSELNSNTFVGLPLLEGLNVALNRISVVHPGTFRGLVSLRELWLYSNELVTLEWNVFRPYPGILICVYVTGVGEGRYDNCMKYRQRLV